MKNETRELVLVSILAVVMVGFAAVKLQGVNLRTNEFIRQANAAMLLR